MNQFDVVMPVYIRNQETLELTKNAITSLGKVHLIIVDNASDVGVPYLKEIADEYICNSDNLGYAKAVNQGLKVSGSGLVAIANNDIRVSPNWQEVVTRVFEYPDVYSCHLRMTDYELPFAYGRRIVTSGMERWCTGSFFVVDTSKEQILFDERFLNSYDDWDFQYRIHKKGYKTAYTDMACYQHHHSFTQKQIPEREENNRKNAELFKKIHKGTAEELFAKQYPEQMQMDYYKGFDL